MTPRRRFRIQVLAAHRWTNLGGEFSALTISIAVQRFHRYVKADKRFKSFRLRERTAQGIVVHAAHSGR